MNEEKCAKVCFLGATSVGKTSIILRKQGQLADPQNTIAPEMVFITVDDIKLIVVDTAGQERFRALSKAYYRDVSIAILVYSVCDKHSFDELQYFYDSLKESSPNAKVVLVGNKTDLPDHIINDEEGLSYAQEINANFVTTSAISGDGIDDLFQQVCQIARDIYIPITPNVNDVDLNENNANKKGCC